MLPGCYHFFADFANLDVIANDYSPGQFFVHAANNLDITIIYKTFGNIKNIVEASLDSAGIVQPIYAETRFVIKKKRYNELGDTN